MQFQQGDGRARQTTEQVVSGSLTGSLGDYGVKSPYAHDGVGALRILAGLLRALERRQVIDLGELAHDLKAQREEAAANFAPAAEVAPYEEAVSGQAAGGDAPAEVAPDPS